MKRFLNGALLAVWALALACALFAFGGTTPDYALPFYLLGAALAALWAAKLLLCRPVSWVWSPLHLPVLGFFAYALVRYFTTPIEHDARLELLQIGLYTLVYFVAACNFYRPRQRTAIVWVLLILAQVEAIYGFWQFGMKSDAVLWFLRPVQYRGRASGTYICPNHLAGLLEIVFLLVLARFLANRTPSRSLQTNFLLKLVEIYVAVFVLAGLYATQSRGGWLATGVGVVAGLFWIWRAKALPPRAIDIALGLIVVLAAIGFSLPVVRERLQPLFSINMDYTFDYAVVDWKDSSLGGRSSLNAATSGIVRDHQLWGSGPGSWRWLYPQYRQPTVQDQPRYAHDDVLQLLADYGAAGFLLVLAALGCFFWQITRFTRPDEPAEQRAFLIGSATAVTAILIHSFVDFNLHIPANAFLVATLFGLTAAISDGDRPFRRREVNTRRRIVLGAGLLVLAIVLALVSVLCCQTARLVTAGDDAREAREWADALRHYTNAIAFDSRFAEPHIGIGDIYRLQSAEAKWSAPVESRRLAGQAVLSYQQALALNPRDAATFLRLAAVEELLGDAERAHGACQQALALDPNNAFHLLRAGQLYQRLDDNTRASACLEKSARLGNAEAAAQLRARAAPRP